MEIIRQELRNFVVQNFLFGEERSLADGDSFLEKGIIDSTGILELVSFLEDKYGIVVQDRELVPENLDCVSALVSFVERKLTLAKPDVDHDASQAYR
jgi:acyl carrier protein